MKEQPATWIVSSKFTSLLDLSEEQYFRYLLMLMTIRVSHFASKEYSITCKQIFMHRGHMNSAKLLGGPMLKLISSMMWMSLTQFLVMS